MVVFYLFVTHIMYYRIVNQPLWIGIPLYCLAERDLFDVGMNGDTRWAGNPEIHAAADLLDTQIWVKSPNWWSPYRGSKKVDDGRFVCLTHVNNNHFQFIRG